MGKRWTTGDIVGLTAIKLLRDNGVSMQRLLKVIARLKKVRGRSSSIRALLGTQLVILSNGDVALAKGDELLNLVSGQQLMALTFPVDLAVKEMQTRMMKAAEKDDGIDMACFEQECEGEWLLAA